MGAQEQAPTRHRQTEVALVADVGGTNTRCALARGPRVRPDTVRKFENAGFVSRGQGLGHVLAAYLHQMGDVACDCAAVAIAGPVRDGAGTLTNLDWHIDRAELARVTGAARAEVLNDLQAQGQGLDHLAPGSVREVVAPAGGSPAPAGATRLVIGAGTGFNAAPVFVTPRGKLVPPAEAGHVSLPLRTEAAVRLARYVETEIPGAEGFASVEDLLSGRGLEHIWRWHAAEAGTPGTCDSRAIVAALAEGGDTLAEHSVRTYVQLLGNVTGDLALTLLPYGGIYFIGGVVRALQPWFGRFGFARAMCDKGRFREFLAQFPVRVVEDDFAALTGCAVYLDDTARAPG